MRRLVTRTLGVTGRASPPTLALPGDVSARPSGAPGFGESVFSDGGPPDARARSLAVADDALGAGGVARPGADRHGRRRAVVRRRDVAGPAHAGEGMGPLAAAGHGVRKR